MRAGTVGQIKGPFQAGRNAFAQLWSSQGTTSEKMKIGISIDEKDLMPFGDVNTYPTGFSFTISGPNNTALVQMGRTGMYESDQPVQVSSLIFTNNAPQSVIVNFVIY